MKNNMPAFVFIESKKSLTTVDLTEGLALQGVFYAFPNLPVYHNTY